MLKFNGYNNSIKQDFSIPSPLIRYVLINMNFKNLKNLFKTCKYFYSRFQINIVDSLYVDNCNWNGLDHQTAYYLSLHSNQINQLPNNLWLAGFLLLSDISNLLPLISKIIRCDLNNSYLAADLTMNEFAFLTHSKTVKLVIIECKIYKSYDFSEISSLEDVLSHLISARYIRIRDCFVTKNTLDKLLLLKFHEKLTCFSLRGINQLLDVNQMNKFLMKNLKDKAGVEIFFKNKDDDRLFLPQLFAKINAWIPEEKKPRSFPSAFIIRQ